MDKKKWCKMTSKKPNKITKDTTIVDAINMNPDAAEVLMSVGLGCVGCMFSEMETIEQGLSAHGMTTEQINEIVEILNDE